jgi:D-lactate dehydrogenase
MDRPSLRSVEDLPGAPGILKQLSDEATAILVEYQAEDAESISRFRKEAERVLQNLKLIHDVEFTDDPTAQASLWKLRKGIIPSVGAMRPPATTLLCEDIVFPVQSLADGVTDLQHLFDKHGYEEGVIFGHAKDGNLHFLIAQSFNTEAETRRFAAFMDDLVRVVSGKYDGALKAEHGTGRNTAPFVETEWGAEAYAIMRDLKSLLDPDYMLNPGVVINPDPRAHVTHVKSIAMVSPQIDKCIECGFCESKCPSRRLTLTPRQRIVVQRELASIRLARLAQAAVPGGGDAASSKIENDFLYAGIETCAVDGLCATACPVGINTGEYIKGLRAEAVTNEKSALWLSDNFALAEKAIGIGVTLGHTAEKMISANQVTSVIKAAEKLTNKTLPKWNRSIPLSSHFRAERTLSKRQRDEAEVEAQFIYFPTCISRQIGTPNSPITNYKSLAETFLTIADRANINLSIPNNVTGHCCGMPFASKGYKQAHRSTLHKTLMQMWDWSAHGKYPIVIDTTSCTHTLRTCSDDLGEVDKAIWKQLTVLDGVEFLHDHVLPRLELHPVDEDVILHPNCSLRKLGLDGKMLSIAKQCARSASVPLNLGCCAFAGDRGLLFPELTASAAEKESAEVNASDYGGYYSSNIPCEIGMSEATGKDYVSIVYLVEKASR